MCVILPLRLLQVLNIGNFSFCSNIPCNLCTSNTSEHFGNARCSVRVLWTVTCVYGINYRTRRGCVW